MPRHIKVYRPILKHALDTAWTHRELWPLAAIAGIAGTGTVVNDILKLGQLGQVFSGFNPFGGLHFAWLTTGPAQATVSSLLVLALAWLGVVLIATCQQIMLRITHHALKQKTHLSFKEIRSDMLHPRVLRFLTLDLFLKLAIVNLVVVSGLLVSYLNFSHSLPDALFGIIFLIGTLTLALCLNILVMLALIGIARQDLSVGRAIIYALRLFRKHTLIYFEVSLLLFAINFLISITYVCTLLILAVPVIFGFLGVLKTGSTFGYLGLASVTSLIVASITVAFAGFTTTFTYAAWTALVERLEKKSVNLRIVAHTKHVIEHFR